jgi:hypothetical protein
MSLLLSLRSVVAALTLLSGNLLLSLMCWRLPYLIESDDTDGIFFALLNQKRRHGRHFRA